MVTSRETEIRDLESRGGPALDDMERRTRGARLKAEAAAMILEQQQERQRRRHV